MSRSRRFTHALLLIASTAGSAWLVKFSISTYGFSSPITAFLLNWLVVALMAVVALSVNLSLPPRYYEVKPFEFRGRVYELVGVLFFKKLVRRGPFSIFSRSFRLPKGNSRAEWRQLDQKMRGAEAIHLFSFLAIWPLISYAIVRKWPAAAAWLLLFNLIVNAYPIMLQRYNRIKLHEPANNQGQATGA